MEIPEEMLDQLASEIFKEMEEEAKAAGRSLTFDDLEGSVFRIRQKIGQQLLQKTADNFGTGKLKKKITKKIPGTSSTKGAKKSK